MVMGNLILVERGMRSFSEVVFGKGNEILDLFISVTVLPLENDINPDFKGFLYNRDVSKKYHIHLTQNFIYHAFKFKGTAGQLIIIGFGKKKKKKE